MLWLNIQIAYLKLLEFNKSNNPNININIGATISKIFISLLDFPDDLCNETPRKEEAKITSAIPRLIAILANNTEKYVFSKKAYTNNKTVPGQGIIPANNTKSRSCFLLLCVLITGLFAFVFIKFIFEESIEKLVVFKSILQNNMYVIFYSVFYIKYIKIKA